MRDLAAHLAAALLLVLFAALAFDAARSKGPTYDETAHLAAGVAYVQTGDFRMNPEHPVLPKLLAGWSASGTGVRADTTTIAWERADQWNFARELIWDGGADWRSVVLAGRVAMIAIGVALGIVLWIWGRALLGTGAALFALFLYALCPNVLAHTPLVTTDVPLTFGVVACAACLWAAHRSGGLRWIALGAFFFGVTMVTKFSAFSYLPAWLALAAWPSAARPLRRGLAHAAWFFLLGALFTEALVLVAYAGGGEWVTIADLGLRGRGVSPDSMSLHRRIPYEILARIPWPSADFARGLKDIVLYTEAGHPVYLLGTRSDSGWWWAPFVMLGVKATIPFLVLATFGTAAAIASKRLRTSDLAFALLPPALCLATNVAANLGLGVRHLLPMFPFGMLLAAWPLKGGGFPAGIYPAAIGVVLAAWHAVASLRAHPDSIAYFNEIAGGARGGIRILGDSNLDWGQDLPVAAARLKEIGVDRAILCYFGTADPFVFGVEWQLLPPTQRARNLDPWIVMPPEGPQWLAMSATNLQGVYSRGPGHDASGKPYPWLDGVEPREVVGGTVYLYEISQNVEVQKALVSAYLRYGLRDEAYAALVRWNRLAPDDPEAKRRLEQANAAGAGSGAGG
jgi:hypothetical protein